MKSALRVAFVAYHFPPIGGGLSHRSLKYVKHLPENDVEVEVFTGELDTEAPCRDDQLLHQIDPDVRVHRCGGHRDGSVARRRGPAVLERLVNRCAGAFSHPDIFAPWARNTFRLFRKRHAEAPFDAIFTTSFPWSTHRVGLRARKELRIRWVSDFRDPWSLNYEQRSRNRLLRAVHRRMEQGVYDASDHVVVNTPGNLADVLTAFDVNPEKFSVIRPSANASANRGPP